MWCLCKMKVQVFCIVIIKSWSVAGILDLFLPVPSFNFDFPKLLVYQSPHAMFVLFELKTT